MPLPSIIKLSIDNDEQGNKRPSIATNGLVSSVKRKKNKKQKILRHKTNLSQIIN